MKKISLAVAICAISYCAQAQNTFPTTGFAGINTTTPATDLQIDHYAHFANNTGMFPGLKLTGFTTVPNNYQIFNYSHNLFEIWSSNNVFHTAPHTNNLIFFVQHDGANAGSVGINKSSATQTLDVGGNIHSDGNIYADVNVEAQNDLVAKHDANITHDANIKHDAIVDNDLTVWQKTRLDNDTYIGGFTTIHTLMNSGIGGTFVLADANGKLDVEHLPTLSYSGGVIKLSNGLSWNTSITLPPAPAGDDLGSHTATSILNMAGYNIQSAGNINTNTLNSSSGISSGGNISTTGSVTCATISSGTLSCSSGATFGATINVAGTNYTSDKRFKKEISPLSSENTIKLLEIIPYSYKFKQGESKWTFDNRTHFGFIAQEVQKLFPNLVNAVDDEHLGVDYVEFIPLLLQSLKEEHEQVKQLQAVSEDKTQQLSALESKVAELESKLNELSNCCTGRTATNAHNTDNNTISVGSTLDQNNPNPFSKESVIGFHIVGEYAKAFIGVYDLNGKELNRLNIDGRSNKVTVSNLQPGMYVYSLIVDGALIDSKKMVVLGE